MHSISMRYESPALGGPARMNILCPPGRGPFPVLYLLHGLGGDCETWGRAYDLDTIAARHRLMIVMPEGGRSYYVNDRRPGGIGRWEDAIVRDVRGVVERAFWVSTDRVSRGIAGVSMGGYGALMLALRHPDIFGACACLSGSLYFGHRPHPHGEVFQDALAAGLPAGAGDVFALAKSIVARDADRPRLWIACGTEDGHLDIQREFHHQLDRLGWSHDYVEAPGAHDRAYWTTQLPSVIAFMASALRSGD